MKHLWFGVGLLAVLLVVSLALGGVLEDAHQPSAKDLEKAAEAAMDENWALASALQARAKKQWQKHRNLSAVLVNHEPLQQIEADFSALERYAACRDDAAFCATCAQLAQQLRSLPETHSLTLWNLL